MSHQPFTVCFDGRILGEMLPDYGELGWANTGVDDAGSLVQSRARPSNDLNRSHRRGTKKMGNTSPPFIIVSRYAIERMGALSVEDDDTCVEQEELDNIDWERVDEEAMLVLEIPNDGYRWDEGVEVIEDRYSTMLSRHRTAQHATRRWLDAERKRRAQEKAENATQNELDAEQARRKDAEQAIEQELARQAVALTRRDGDAKFMRMQASQDALRIERMRHREALRVARWKFSFHADPAHRNLEVADAADTEVKRLLSNPPGKKPRRATQQKTANAPWRAPTGNRGGQRRGGNRDRKPSGERRGGRGDRLVPSMTCAQCGESHPADKLFLPGLHQVKEVLGRFVRDKRDLIDSGTIKCSKCRGEGDSFVLIATVIHLDKRARIDVRDSSQAPHDQGSRKAS
jgi:hypothetical protein